MKMLVIGGTRFLGRFITEEALRRNHEVTLFNRGLTNRGLFDQVETIYGDRVKEIERLGGRNFDSVIDTCGFVPWGKAFHTIFVGENRALCLYLQSVGLPG